MLHLVIPLHMRKPALQPVELAGRNALRLLGLFTALFRKRDDILLLVTLIDLNAEHRRRGRRFLSLLLLNGMDSRPGRSRGHSATLVQSLGIGCVDRVG